MQTSINIQPCKVTASERHNKREKQLSYTRPELSHLNEWYNTLDVHLKSYDARLRKLIKAKTGRACQAKSHPLHEAVVVIRPDTTMNDIKKLADAMSARWGFHFVQMAIHKDEGHWKNGAWTPNLHAHMVFDKIDHDTGKTIKTTKADTAEMQDMCAEVLGMERGKKGSTAKHLDALSYKIAAEEKRAEAQTKAIALQSVLGGLAIHAVQKEQAAIEERTQAKIDEAVARKSKLEVDNVNLFLEGLKKKRTLNTLEQDIKKATKNIEIKRSELSLETSRVNAKEETKKSLESEITALKKDKEALSQEILKLNQDKDKADKEAKESQDRADKVAIIAMQKINKSIAEVAKAPKSQSVVEAQKAGSIWKQMLYSIWESAAAAVDVLLKYLYYPHLNVSFGCDEVKAIDNAMKSAETIEERKAYGRDLVKLANAEFPGYSQDSTRIWELNHKVEEVADRSNRWVQDINRYQGRGLGM